MAPLWRLGKSNEQINSQISNLVRVDKFLFGVVYTDGKYVDVITKVS